MTELEQVASQTASGLKNSMKGVVAWAKKNPMIAALLIGGVILLAFVTTKNSASVGTLHGGDGGTTDADDLLGGGGGFGLLDIPEYSTPQQLGDIITQPVVDYTVPSGAPQSYVIPTGVIYPGDLEEEELWDTFSDEYDQELRKESYEYARENRTDFRDFSSGLSTRQSQPSAYPTRTMTERRKDYRATRDMRADFRDFSSGLSAIASSVKRTPARPRTPRPEPVSVKSLDRRSKKLKSMPTSTKRLTRKRIQRPVYPSSIGH